MDATDILNAVGADGKFQVVFIICIQSLRILVITTWSFMVFGIYQPPWTCLDGRSEDDPVDEEILRNSSFHKSTSYVTSDQNFNLSYDTSASDFRMLNSSNSNVTPGLSFNGTCETHQSCQDVYFQPGSSTIVTEWQLMCDTAWIPPLMITVHYSGYLLGSVLSGRLGERFGRKPTMYTFSIVAALISCVAIFSPNWETFIVIQFVFGASLGGIATMSIVYAVESTGPKCISFLAIFPTMGVSYGLFGIEAYFLRDWRMLYVVMSICLGLACVPAIWIPESVRWLYVKGRTEKLRAVARKISKINGQTEFPENIRAGNPKETAGDQYGYFDLFRERRQCWITISIVSVFIVRQIVQHMVGLSIKSLEGDFYINMLVYALCEIPVFLIAMPTVKLLGNKRSLLFFFAVAFLCVTAVVVLNLAVPDSGMAVTYLALAAKLSNSACNQISTVYAGELFPTVVRGVGLGLCVSVGILGAIIAPFLIPTADDSSLPRNFSIVGGCLLLVCVLMLTLPDTKSRPLQDFIRTDNNNMKTRDPGSNEEHAMLDLGNHPNNNGVKGGSTGEK